MKRLNINIANNPLECKVVNIIISIYDGEQYIEECLDSIKQQTYSNYHILLGVDGCKNSLKKILEIRNNYPKLEIYYSKKNEGVYKMFNALIDLVPEYQYILFFGADDVMNKNMLEVMQKNQLAVSRHHGILFIKKEFMNIFGGYRAWRCGADTDMIRRIQHHNKKKMKYEPQLFFRRVHDKQLTTAKATGYDSDMRNKYYKICQDNIDSENPVVYIEPKKSKIVKL